MYQMIVKNKNLIYINRLTGPLPPNKKPSWYNDFCSYKSLKPSTIFGPLKKGVDSDITDLLLHEGECSKCQVTWTLFFSLSL